MSVRAHAVAPAGVRIARSSAAGRQKVHPILELQRAAGNRAVASLLQGGTDPHESVAYGRAFSFRGLTRASYSHSSTLENEQVNEGERTGTHVETFNVRTSVSLPRIPSGLTDCERPIVDEAINVTLAAHEQEHVEAFEGYNGTERTPYSVTGGANARTRYLNAQHAANESARRSAADGASALLDPYKVDVDTSACDDVAAAESEPATEPPSEMG